MMPATEMIEKQDPIYALARSHTALYAARESGLYHSCDEGRSWHNTLTSLTSSEPILVTALAVCNTMLFAGSKGAVLRSEDAGSTWQICGLASPPPLVTALGLSPNFEYDGLIAAATAEDGVFISTDRGQSWTGWNFGLIDMNVFALALSPNFEHDGVMFAGTDSGIFRSHDRGRGWNEVDFPMDAAPVLSLALSPMFARDGVMVAGTEHSGLFRSDDCGVSWQKVTADFGDSPIQSLQFDTTRNSKIWILTDSRLLMTEDGQQFIEAYPGNFPPHSMATALLKPLSSQALLVGFAGGELLHLS